MSVTTTVHPLRNFLKMSAYMSSRISVCYTIIRINSCLPYMCFCDASTNYVCLLQLEDYDDLHELVGTAIYKFVEEKRNAFPNATLSKADFFSVKAWKRAMTWVFLLRFLLDMVGQKQWRNFSLEDYKLNKRAFHRWITKDAMIMSNCADVRSLPRQKSVHVKRIQKKGKRKKNARGNTSTEDSPP